MRATKKRIEAWESKLQRADNLVESVIQDLVAVKLSARGGALSYSVEAIKALRESHPSQTAESVEQAFARLRVLL